MKLQEVGDRDGVLRVQLATSLALLDKEGLELVFVLAVACCLTHDNVVEAG